MSSRLSLDDPRFDIVFPAQPQEVARSGYSAVGGPYKYFCDQSKRWAFFTGEEGKKLLEELNKSRRRAMEIVELTREEEEQARILYERKPNRSEGVTWSQEEYASVPFQIRYIELKSLQRFTEMYSFVQRAYNKGNLT